MPAASAPASVRPASIKADLPLFRGRDSDDVNAWISIIEDYLTAQHVPIADWVTQTSILLRDDAMRSYIAVKKEKVSAGQSLDWDGLKTWLKAFRGNLARYSEQFRTHLPPDIARDLRREKPTKPEEMYHNARELDRLSNLHRDRGSQNANSASKKAKGFFKRSNSHSFTHSDAFSAPPLPASTTSSSSTTGPVPMDLDGFQTAPRGHADGNKAGTRSRFPQGSRSRPSAPAHDFHVFENAQCFPDALPPLEEVTAQLGVSPALHALEQVERAESATVLPTYSVRLADWQQTAWRSADAIIDTGAEASYGASRLDAATFGQRPNRWNGSPTLT